MLPLSSGWVCILLPLIQAAVIEKASVLESAKALKVKDGQYLEYYDRIKTIPVDCVSQEIDDPIIRELQNVKQLLLTNPLLRNFPMFKEKSEERDLKDCKGTPPLKIFSKSMNRIRNYKRIDDNFDEDYVRLNETFFQDEDMPDTEVRRLPIGRLVPMSSRGQEDSVPEVPVKDEENQPFAVTESLIKMFERGETEAAIPQRVEKMSTQLTALNSPLPVTNIVQASDSTPSFDNRLPDSASINDRQLTSSPSKLSEFQSSTLIPSDNDVSPILQGPAEKKKNESAYGLKKSEFQGFLYLREAQNPTNWLETSSSQDFLRVTVGPDHQSKNEELSKTMDEVPFHEIVIEPRERGGYIVSGTRYYVDNRVEGGVLSTPDVMKDDYKLLHDSKEHSEMMKDPRFAVEAELSQMRKVKSRKRFVLKGAKTQEFENLEENIQKDAFEPEPPSIAWMMRKGGRLFEKRSTSIGGKLVTVELGNKDLHGVDLIVRPGSVVNGPMPISIDKNVLQKRTTDKRNRAYAADTELGQLSKAKIQPYDLINAVDLQDIQADPKTTVLSIELKNDAQTVDACFHMQADTRLSKFAPIRTGFGLSEIECLALCARIVECRSLNYAGSVSSCEIFDRYEKSSALKQQLGYIYYKPKRKDLKNCMSDVLSISKNSWIPEIDSDVRCTSIGICSTKEELRTVESRARTPFNRLFSSRATCSSGLATLFVRSMDSHNEKKSNSDTVIDMNEDDCLFSCLRNKGMNMRPKLCATAEYDKKHQRCILSAESRKNDLLPHPYRVFYEKICVSIAVADQCSGAALDRKANMAITSFLRDVTTTTSPEECIEKCVMAERNQGFQCLSIMYYYNETLLNCVLNDASAKTNPESMAEENEVVVDYFGVDDCYGMPEVADTRQTFLRNLPLLVEDDVIQRNPTPGSILKVLRQTRSTSNPTRR